MMINFLLLDAPPPSRPDGVEDEVARGAAAVPGDVQGGRLLAADVVHGAGREEAPVPEAHQVRTDSINVWITPWVSSRI